MTVRIDFLDNDIIIDENGIFVIECENKIYFYRIVNLFNQLSYGNLDDAIHFFQFNNQIDCSNKVEVIIDYFNIDFSNKKYQSKILEMLRGKIEVEDNLKLTSELKKIQKIIERNLGRIDIPIELMGDIDTVSFIKNLRFNIITQNSIFNNLLLLVDIEKVFKINKFLVLINLRQYLTSGEIKELYKYALYNGIKLLLIDSQTYGVSNEYERKLLIDSDLNEFML